VGQVEISHLMSNVLGHIVVCSYGAGGFVAAPVVSCRLGLD